MRLRKLAILACLLLPLPIVPAARASETPTEHKANVAAAEEKAAAPVHGNLPDYSLSPEKLAKAQHLETTGVVMNFASTIWSVVQMALLLWLGVVAWMRDKAVQAGSGMAAKGRRRTSRWIEGFTFLLLFLVIGFVLDLPLHLYGHHLGLAYGLSVQGWASWFWDQAKSMALAWVIGGLILMLLFWVIRKWPRRWWLIFWAFSIPISLFGTFISPYFGPIFNKYEPLAKANPELVAKIQQVVERGHMNIPADRMYLMKASAKTTQLNADVEGFGHSKRVVVWDNTLTKATPDQVLFIFGHESGHYVLGHIVSGVYVSIALTFITLFVAYVFLNWALRRFGAAWRIPSQGDWGALGVIVLGMGLYGILLQPVMNSLIRIHEHDADVYGQEAIHGIVADPQASARGAFQVLGETSIDEPNTPVFLEYWLDGHPSIGRRAAFAAHYDPWAPGEAPKYFKK